MCRTLYQLRHGGALLRRQLSGDHGRLAARGDRVGGNVVAGRLAVARRAWLGLQARARGSEVGRLRRQLRGFVEQLAGLGTITGIHCRVRLHGQRLGHVAQTGLGLDAVRIQRQRGLEAGQRGVVAGAGDAAVAQGLAPLLDGAFHGSILLLASLRLQRAQRRQRTVVRPQRGDLQHQRIGLGQIARLQCVVCLHRQCIGHLVEPVRGHRVARVGAQHALIQRAGTVGAIQLAIRQRLPGLVDQVDGLHLVRLRLADQCIEPIHVATAAKQFAGDRRALGGLIQLTSLQRGVGARQFGLANLAQAIAGAIVVRFAGGHLLEQLASAGAVLAIQMSGSQCLLRLRQHAVEVGTRQHAAQTVLVEPQRRAERGHQHDQHRQQPAAAPARTLGAGRPGVARFHRHPWQAIGGSRARRVVQAIEIAQGGLAAARWPGVVRVAAAHEFKALAISGRSLTSRSQAA
ncbi:hypothetical protein RLIN73S_02121 [Rhodanobacter lindaniclasticus]